MYVMALVQLRGVGEATVEGDVPGLLEQGGDVVAAVALGGLHEGTGRAACQQRTGWHRRSCQGFVSARALGSDFSTLPPAIRHRNARTRDLASRARRRRRGGRDALVGRGQRDPHVLVPGGPVEVAREPRDAVARPAARASPGRPPPRSPTGRARPRSRRRAARTASTAGSSAARRAAYRAFCAATWAASDRAASTARCTGHGTIIPACLRTSSSRPTRAGSPATKPRGSPPGSTAWTASRRTAGPRASRR